MTGRWAAIAAELNGETVGPFVTCVTIVSPAREADAASVEASVTKVTIVTDSDYPDIHAEPPLPAPGTPARDALDAKQADICAGLLRCAIPSRQPRRIQGWMQAFDRAVPGDRCGACLGRQWWIIAQGAGGCVACQPRPAGASGFVT